MQVLPSPSLLTNLYPASLTTLTRQGDDVKKAIANFGSLTLIGCDLGKYPRSSDFDAIVVD